MHLECDIYSCKSSNRFFTNSSSFPDPFMTSLPRVRTGLLQHALDEQVLVYDSRGDNVHLLDPTTACVLTLLGEGGWTREGIAAELSSRLGVENGAAMLPLAIEELRAADMLDVSAPVPEPMIDVTRRDLLKKVAIGGAAALLIPAVMTFTASPAYAGGSGVGTLGSCAPCTDNSQCASGVCQSNGACTGTGSSNKTANGLPCSGGSQSSANQTCCSGSCSSNPGICNPP